MHHLVSMTLFSSDKANKCTLLEHPSEIFTGYIIVYQRDGLPRNNTYKICISNATEIFDILNSKKSV